MGFLQKTVIFLQKQLTNRDAVHLRTYLFTENSSSVACKQQRCCPFTGTPLLANIWDIRHWLCPKVRKKTADEPQNPYRVRKTHQSLRCSKCNKYGHNARTCKGPLNTKKRASPSGRGRGGRPPIRVRGRSSSHHQSHQVLIDGLLLFNLILIIILLLNTFIVSVVCA